MGLSSESLMLSDFRFGARTLVRTPATALAAVVALALGIGANTAIFSVVHAVLLEPLPYDEADRIVMVWQDLRKRRRTERRVGHARQLRRLEGGDVGF